MQTTREHAKARVTKLRKLAGNNPSPAEAAAASAKAQELTLRHGLEPHEKLTPLEVAKYLRDYAKNPPEKRVTIADGAVRGLALRVTSNGHASWSVEYQRPAASRELTAPKVIRARYTIGDAREIGLAEARRTAEDVRAAARGGADPHFDAIRAALRADEAAKQAKTGNVAKMVEQWLASAETKRWRPVTRAGNEGILRKYVLPEFGAMDAKSITKAHVRALLDKVHAVAPVTSNRMLYVLRGVWGWARERDLVAMSPCDGLKRLEKERKRDRVYTDDELRAIARAVKGTELEDLIMFLMRTATRSHETRAMRWSDIDVKAKVWTIPAELAKSGRKHKVPLSDGAWAIVARRHKARGTSPWVFAGITAPCKVCAAAGHAGVPSNRLLKACSIAVGLLVKVSAPGARAEWTGTPLRLHDLRRTVADRCVNTLGLAIDVVDFGLLAHAAGPLVQVYMPSGISLDRVREALALWDRHLDQVLAGGARKRKAA